MKIDRSVISFGPAVGLWMRDVCGTEPVNANSYWCPGATIM